MTVRGQLYIVAAPSGAGKTSLVRALLDITPGVALSVSHTTRPARPGELEGVHYHFVDVPGFEALVAAGGFLEHARVFDNYYGTSRGAVERQLAAGLDVILEIDWQGAQQVRAAFPKVRGVFIVPPSIDALRARLIARGQDDDAVIERRMRDARIELAHWEEFDYLVVNDDFDAALSGLRAIFVGARLERARQAARHGALIAALLS